MPAQNNGDRDAQPRPEGGWYLGTVASDFGDAAFFNPGSVTWNLTAKVGGTSKKYSGVVNLEAKKWSKVTFSTSSTNGVISITINVDGTMTEVPVSAPVDPLK